MEQTQFSSMIQGFQLQVSIKDPHHLYLNAQNLQDNRQFHLELDDVAITQITRHLFIDVQSMAQALKDATNNASSDFKLSLDNNGKLTYSAGTPPQENSFSFNLIEAINPESAVSLKNKVETLEKELEKVKLQHIEELTKMRLEYEEKIAKLPQTILQEQEKNLKYEEESSRIQYNDVKSSRPIRKQFAPGQLIFGGDTPSTNNFEFSDDDKTAKLVEWDEDRALRCYPQVPDKGRHAFALKVNQVGHFIAFGITTRESGRFYQGDEGCYFYFINHGMLLTKGFQTSDRIEGAGGKDSIVEMTVDMDARVLGFTVDGKQVRSCKLKEDEKKYTVFVDFASLEDSVTLL